jgi:coenzyme PQQ biosynthesis protein PqqD
VIDPRERPRLAAKARLRFDKPTQTHLLLYPERGMKLNATGTAIVQLCDGTNTVLAIVAALAATYEQPAEQLSREVDAFLQALADRGLIDWVTT